MSSYDRRDKATLRRPLEPEQYTAVSFTEALERAGIAPSVGTVGYTLDNALMESTIGLYKTELVDHDRARTWSGAAELERETASWVHWYNTTRIHHSIGKICSARPCGRTGRLTKPTRRGGGWTSGG